MVFFHMAFVQIIKLVVLCSIFISKSYAILVFCLTTPPKTLALHLLKVAVVIFGVSRVKYLYTKDKLIYLIPKIPS